MEANSKFSQRQSRLPILFQERVFSFSLVSYLADAGRSGFVDRKMIQRRPPEQSVPHTEETFHDSVRGILPKVSELVAGSSGCS